MKTEIILLIIAFQVVAGILAKRKAKKAAEAARNPSASAPQAAQAPERQEKQRVSPASRETAGRPAEDKGKAVEMGKDLLSQLAKELGLEIPGQRKPAPRPVAQPSAPPQAKPAPQPVRDASLRTQPARPISPQTAAAQRAETAKRPVQRPFIPEAEPEAPREIGNASVTQDSEARTVSSLARESLQDADSIRRAFILKTIFDKPLALRPRRPGEA